MRTEKLTLGHKSLLYERLRGVNTQISEYSFPNLYLFRHIHSYEVVLDEDVFIRGVSYDGHTYLMPTRDLREVDIKYLKAMAGGVDFIYPVPVERLDLFPESEFGVSYHDGDTDYVYKAEKLRTFGGRRLHKKRNLLKQFVSFYKHESHPLTSDRLGDAELVLRDWLLQSGQEEKDTDFGPCLESLRLYEDLVLCGCIYYADGEPAGFVVGEELNPETFVLHFAKARVKFKGAYQFVFNSFASVLPDRYRLINLEQDLDKEALRIAKSSYVPDMMLRKARVRPAGPT